MATMEAKRKKVKNKMEVADVALTHHDCDILEQEMKALNISVKPNKIKFDPTTDYKNDSGPPRGAIFIANYREFENTSTRKGSEYDKQHLSELFSQIGYKVKVIQDCTREETLDAMQSFKEDKVHEEVSSLVIAVMSHGKANSNDKTFVTSDMKTLTSQDIYEIFSDENCQALKGKPKVYIFLHCRKSSINVSRISQPKRDNSISDTMLLYSTIAGQDSYLHENLGSVYIYQICQVFMEKACQSELDDLMDEVDKSMSKFQRCEWIEIEKMKDFYFNPIGCNDEEDNDNNHHSNDNHNDHSYKDGGFNNDNEDYDGNSNDSNNNDGSDNASNNNNNNSNSNDDGETNNDEVTTENPSTEKLVLLINNLEGCCTDMETLKVLFTSMGYIVIGPHVNVNYTKLKEVIKDFKEKDHGDNAFIIFYGDGFGDNIVTSDYYAIHFNELQREFNDSNCQKLSASPKIFIMNLCYLDCEVDVRYEETDHAESNIPAECDMFLLNVEIANGHCENGSLLTKALNQEMRKIRSPMKLIKIMRSVSKKLNELQLAELGRKDYICELRRIKFPSDFEINPIEEALSHDLDKCEILTDLSTANISGIISITATTEASTSALSKQPTAESTIFRDAMKCKICCEAFSLTDRRPRNFSCGHSFCTPCCAKLVSLPPVRCPLCMKTPDKIVRHVNEIPIAFQMEGILQALGASTEVKNTKMYSSLMEDCDGYSDEKYEEIDTPGSRKQYEDFKDIPLQLQDWYPKEKAEAKIKIRKLKNTERGSSSMEEFDRFFKEKIREIDTQESRKQYEDFKSDPAIQAKLLQQLIFLQQPKTKKYWSLRKILLEAVKTGNRRAVTSAIKHGADAIPYLRSLPGVSGMNENEFACTFLGLAAMHGHHNLLDCLIMAGIDIDDQGGTNRAPLHLAVERNDFEFTRKLLKAGANIEATTYEMAGFTALHLAVRNGHLGLTKLLLQEKANIEALDQFNYTPLHAATLANKLSAIELLLDYGCNRDARIHLGGTALHVAAMYNNKDAAELLIKRGFDLELKDKEGHTPAESAEVRGHASIAHWLAKLRYTKFDGSDVDISPSIGPLSSPEQTAKYEYSAKIYETDNQDYFSWIDKTSKESYAWKALRLIIPNINSGYYQDDEGLTILHVASKNGLFDAVKLLVEELEIYPNLKTHNGFVPADLARQAGHHKIVNYLKSAVKQKILSINSTNELYAKLLTVISSSDNVQTVSRLLTHGAPLESYGKTRPSALSLAILCNRVQIMELLLAAGAPLTVKHHGKTLLQVAWFEPDVNIRVKIIIKRAYFNNLKWELEQQNIKIIDSPGRMYLAAGFKEFMSVLSGETPWKARWKIQKGAFKFLGYMSTLLRVRPISKDLIGFSLVMGTAAKHNCKLASFLLYQAGGHPNIRTGLGLTPLHEALDSQFYDMATVMVKHLDASLYIPDCNGRLPQDLMPTHMKEQLEQEQVTAEFIKLEESVISARSVAEKEEIKEIALVLVCLYSTFTKLWDHDLCRWQDLHHYLVSLTQIQRRSETKDLRNIQNDEHAWVTSICKNLNKLNKINHIQIDEAAIGFLDLLSCIEDLGNNIRIQENMINCILSAKNNEFTDVSTSNSVLKSIKIASENNYKSFLHLLFTIGKQSKETHLNKSLQSLPLHHAAAAGNLNAVLYLTLSCGASLNVLDRNGNTPAHLAYMNGYRYIGDYLCKCDKQVELIMNNADQTPKLLRKAFKEYEKLYDIVEDEDENIESERLTEQIGGMYLSTQLLEHWLTKAKRVSMSFKKIMNNSIVDYSYGEAKHLYALFVGLGNSIGRKITEYNPLLKGTLVPVGSAGDNVCLNAPDEYDCTWILDWKDIRVNLVDMSNEDQVMNKYKHIIRAESDDPKKQYLLDGTNLLEEFYNQSVKAVLDIVPDLDPRLSLILPGVKRIGCGVCITFAWAGTTYPMLIVNMDLVPAFNASRPANFPHPPLTKKLEDPRLDSIFVVQTHIQAGEKRCATTLEEQVVMEQLSSEQRLVFMLAKLLVSKLKTEKWASRIFKDRFTFFTTNKFKLPAPTGFLLKSAFFQELERITDQDDWKENCIVDRLKCIFSSMCQKTDGETRFVSGLVSSYFSSTTQPPATGFMAPAIYRFLVDNEEILHKMEDSRSDIAEAEELERLVLMWEDALNKYYYIP